MHHTLRSASEGLQFHSNNVAVKSHPGSYRPAIDGLRALAVIAVIVNHLEAAWWPFGFLGVDVFFVISGFVVTLSLISRPLKNPKAFLLGFYSRRVRRLLPALVVCVVVASILAVLVIYPGSLERATSLRTGLSALVGASNIFLLTQNTDYFGISAELNLFLHTWSLGVEEQFYLFFPLIWLFCSGRRRALTVCLLILCCGSGLLQAGVLQQQKAWGYNAAFYLMPARFWELGSGALLALILPKGKAIRSEVNKTVSQLSALLLLLALLWLLLKGSPVHVWSQQLAVVVVTTLLIACLEIPGVVTKCLSGRLLVAIGLRSYGLYLWHWPLLVLMRWTVGFSITAVLAVVALTGLLAWLSFDWIETPLRRRRWAARTDRELIFGVGVLGLGSAVLGLLFASPVTKALWLGQVRPKNYVPPRNFPHLAYAPLIPGSSISRSACYQRFSFTSAVHIDRDSLAKCHLDPHEPGLPTIFVYGDSYAGHLSPLLNILRDKHRFGVEMLISAQCPFPSRTNQPGHDCHRFGIERQKRVLSAAQSGDILLLATSAREPGGRYTPSFLNQLSILSRTLQRRGVRVVLQSPIPRFSESFEPVCVYPLQWFQPGAEQRCGEPHSTRREQQAGWIMPLLEQLKPLQRQDGLEVWDAFGQLCPPDQDVCSTHYLGDRLYRDRGHLSGRGAEKLFPSLENFLLKKDNF